MWDSLEHLLSEQGINLPRKYIKEHLLLTERKQLSTKFDELSKDYKTLALITVADLILNKQESKWRAGLLKSMESDKGIILETNDARNSINRILSKVEKYLIGSGISDIDVSSLNTLLNVNLNRSDYVRLARAFKLEGAENLVEEEEQDEPGIGVLPDGTTSDNTLLVVDTTATSSTGDDNVSMMTSETTEHAKRQSKKRLTSATSLTSSATTTSLSTHTSAASLSTKSESAATANDESKMASTLSNDATETDTSLEDKQSTGSLNIESSTQLLDADISKSRQQQLEIREDEGQSTASTSMLVSVQHMSQSHTPPEKQIPEEQSDIQRQEVTTVPEPLSVSCLSLRCVPLSYHIIRTLSHNLSLSYTHTIFIRS